MGFADDVAKRISAAFRRDKEQANIQLAKGATGELGGGDSSALDLMSGVGYDALTDYLRLDTDLLMRFADYEEMDDFGEIATALDILADDATQPDSVLHRTIWITSADKTLQNNLDDLFNKTLRMDEEIWEIARTLCKYGNEFEELLVNSDGVRGLNYLPPPTVRRLETPKGDLIGFMQDFKGRFDYSASEYQRVLMTKFEAPVHDSTDAPVAAFESWEVVHFRLRGKERRCLRGTAKVSTPSGLREIQSLRPGDLVFAFDGMGLVQTQVVASGQTGVKKVFSIKTRHREVVATSEHPLLVFSKKRGYHWKSVSDVCEDDLLTLPTTAAPPPSQVRLKDPAEFSSIRLTPAGVQVVKDARNGDRYFFEKLGLEFRDISVFFSGNTSISTADFEKASTAIPALREDLCFVSHKPNRENFVHSPEFVDPAFAWLFGLLLGDGWIDDHGVSVALGIYPDLNDRIEAAFRSYGLHSSPRYEDITYPETGEIVRVLRTFVVHSSDLADILCNLGFITGAKNKRVPAWVYSSSEEVRRAVVEGFIAADGWDVHQHGKDAIRYEIANRDMAYDFKALVDSLGWTSGNVCVRKERLGKVSTHPAMRGKVVNSSESYILHFHMTPFAASGTVRHERVVKKSELSSDPEPVFDIQIDHPSHAFIADGVVVHNSVYGHSALEAARWIWKRLMLLEDAALVYRLQRAPERFAFYVDVGDLPPQEALAFVNRVRQNFRKKRFVDPGTGKLNLKFDALSQDEDFFVPTRKGVDSTRIDTLGSPQWQAMDDIEYFRDKLFAAIKVPKAYLGQESGVARAVLSSEDVRFARTVLRIQRELKNGLRKIARVHLSALGIDPYSAEYDVNMTVPSAIFELAQMEVRTAKADLAARMRDFVSLQWILSNVFGLSEDEIAVIKKERGGESADDAKNQAAAQDILAPPPPPMDAPPEGGPPEGAPPEEGPYGPPAEARQPNRILKALNSSRDAARRRGIPTRSGFSDRELNEGRNPAAEKRADAKLDAILKADRGLELRLREIGGLLRDINHRGSR